MKILEEFTSGMTHLLSFFYPSFLLGAEQKREEWVMDTSENFLRTHLGGNL